MAQSRVLADFRLAVRHLRRAPGYAVTAILTFALAAWLPARRALAGAPQAILRQV